MGGRTTVYDIDLFKCIWCGHCEESYPTDAIVLANKREYRWERRYESIISKEMLLALGTQYEAEIARDRAADAPYR
jgi:NADH-quinone oxidoreductase subunit I